MSRVLIRTWYGAIRHKNSGGFPFYRAQFKLGDGRRYSAVIFSALGHVAITCDQDAGAIIRCDALENELRYMIVETIKAQRRPKKVEAFIDA